MNWGSDLSTAIRGKIAKNERKYPAEEYRGRYGPEDTGKETGPVRARKEGGTAKGQRAKEKAAWRLKARLCRRSSDITRESF